MWLPVHRPCGAASCKQRLVITLAPSSNSTSAEFMRPVASTRHSWPCRSGSHLCQCQRYSFSMRGILGKPKPTRHAGRHAQTMCQVLCRRGFSCTWRSRVQPVRLCRSSFAPTKPVDIGALLSVVRMPFSFSLLPNRLVNQTAGYGLYIPPSAPAAALDLGR